MTNNLQYVWTSHNGKYRKHENALKFYPNGGSKLLVDAINIHVSIDLETQPPQNYVYDPVGNMIEDKSRDMSVYYTYSNKPKRIKIGNRVIKMKYTPSGYRFFKGSGNKGDIFIYNSQGQLLAKYSIGGNTLKLEFMPIYEGTKRLGMLEVSGVEWQDCPHPGFPPCNPYRVGSGIPEGRVLRANRKYELTDHLNNVRVVIADQRFPMPDSNNQNVVAYYKPLVKEISDYYPYGWQKFLGKYQFGANAGSLFENWDSTKGTYYTLYRLLDSRIARWYQVEPLIDSFPVENYIFSGNNPILYVDYLGDYKMTQEDVNKYSNFANYIANYIKNDVLLSSEIVNALSKFTNGNLSIDELEKILTWGEGPLIKIVEEPGYAQEGITGAAGYYDYLSNTIELRKDYVERLEKVLGSNASASEKLKYLLPIYITILHETVHYGDYLDGERQEGEPGYEFESYVWYEVEVESEGESVRVVYFFGDKYDPEDVEEIINTKGEDVLPTVPKNESNK